nr:hypothetical protein [Tanacetum cinerariifolium]
MADENIPALAPTRSDDQILPFAAWNTLTYKAKTRAYNFQLDEYRFVLDANLLREALEITPIDKSHQFVSPPSGDVVMDFVNELVYIEARIPSSSDALGIITSINVNYAELMREEFVQATKTFLTDKANLSSPTKKGRKDKACVISNYQFTKLINCHLVRTHNIHQRSASLFHLAEEDFRLGNLKFVPKDEEDKVFGMPIPNELISKNIKNVPYYNAYMEMVAKHDRKITAEKEGKKKPATAKQLKSKPHSQMGKVLKTCKGKSSFQLFDEEEPTQPEPKPKHQGEKDDKATRPLLVVEEQAAQSLSALHTPKRRGTIDQFILQRQNPVIEEASTGPSAQPQDDTSANIFHESQSPADAETGANTDKTNNGGDTEILQIGEEQGDDMANMVNLEEKTDKIDQGQAISDLVPIHQASSLVPPLSTPIIGLSPPKTVSSTTQAPIFTAITTTTTTRPLPPPPPQQSTSNSRVFTLELRDQPHKINQTVNEVVKEAVHVALQAPLPDHFRELPETDVKEILHQRMFETGTYKSLAEHVALYEDHEVSMERANRDGFLTKKDKSRKRCRDDQDPPLPPPYSYLKADYKEYKISEADFKNLHPNDFEDLYMLHLQEEYTIVSKPRAVIYRVRNDQKKKMQETEVHKFSDGTLNRILDKLDHMVKDFKLYEYNSSMETRIWSEDDRRRSKNFMEVIEHRLKIMRIFKSLEIFVGERLRDVDYRLI